MPNHELVKLKHRIYFHIDVVDTFPNWKSRNREPRKGTVMGSEPEGSGASLEAVQRLGGHPGDAPVISSGPKPGQPKPLVVLLTVPYAACRGLARHRYLFVQHALLPDRCLSTRTVSSLNTRSSLRSTRYVSSPLQQISCFVRFPTKPRPGRNSQRLLCRRPPLLHRDHVTRAIS